jgi:hypothetical protein
MAANPLFISKARAVYPDLGLGFFAWLQGSIVLGLVTLAIIPFLLWKMTFGAPDDTYDAASVTKHAEIELGRLGKMSTKEIVSISLPIFMTGTVAMYFSEAYVSRSRWIAIGWLIMRPLALPGGVSWVGCRVCVCAPR